MKIAHSVITSLMVLSFALTGNADEFEFCHFLKSGGKSPGYDTGGPYQPNHFKANKDRQDLREFLWNHWHDHTKGIAKVRASTIDDGTITELYVVHPNAKEQWGIDVERDNPFQSPPPCYGFRIDSVLRIPIGKPHEPVPYSADGKIPEEPRLADSEVRKANEYLIVLLINERVVEII